MFEKWKIEGIYEVMPFKMCCLENALFLENGTEIFLFNLAEHVYLYRVYIV